MDLGVPENIRQIFVSPNQSKKWASLPRYGEVMVGGDAASFGSSKSETRGRCYDLNIATLKSALLGLLLALRCC